MPAGRPTTLSEEKQKKVIEMYADNVKVYQIAKTLGITYNQIKYYLKKQGLWIAKTPKLKVNPNISSTVIVEPNSDIQQKTPEE